MQGRERKIKRQTEQKAAKSEGWQMVLLPPQISEVFKSNNFHDGFSQNWWGNAVLNSRSKPWH